MKLTSNSKTIVYTQPKNINIKNTKYICCKNIFKKFNKKNKKNKKKIKK